MSAVVHPYRAYLAERQLSVVPPPRRHLVEIVLRFHLAGIGLGIFVAMVPLVLYLILSPAIYDHTDDTLIYVVLGIWFLSQLLAFGAGWLRSDYDEKLNARAFDRSDRGYAMYRAYLADTPQSAWYKADQDDIFGDVARYAGYGPFIRWMWRSNCFVWGVVVGGVLFVASIALTFLLPGQMPVLLRISMLLVGLLGMVACMQVGAMRETGRLDMARNALETHLSWQECYLYELTLPVQDKLPAE